MANLYIIGTPIGNLQDITTRALETLKGADLILCEDTRVAKKLLEHYQIRTPVLSFHQHSKLNKVNYILNLLKNEKNLALISDAGTPGISDPGNKLINLAIRELNNLRIIPIPGPSAVTAAASISGFPTDKFIFLGFPPAKRKRKKFFEEVGNYKYPIIFYESSHRIIKTLTELNFFIAKQGFAIGERQIMVCRELTKKFETIYRGKVSKVIEEIKKDKIKGEFVVIVEGKR